LQIYITCILKATIASAPSDAQRKSCSFANGYVMFLAGLVLSVLLMLKAPYLCIVTDGLLLMETIKFVVAVTHHVALMVNLLLLPMEVGSVCSF